MADDEVTIERLALETAPGLTIVVDVQGPVAGPTVLLLHGGGQTRHAWRGTAGVLARSGWRTASMDMRGHGESSWAPDGAYAIDTFAADAALVADHLGGRPVLVGASLGGIASLVAVGEGMVPAARALVLVDVAPRISQKGVDRITGFMLARPDGFASLDEVADAIAAYNPHRPRPTDLDGLRRNVRQRSDGRWVWHWDPRFLTDHDVADETRVLGYEERFRDAARALTVPTLLVRGARSDLLEEEGAADLQELVPHARYARVDGAGHMVAGDRNDAFNDAILGFLDDLSG
ncbi:alpha/beta hydrolase [Iamia sp. SCSIO 61187]|uniref:alpha/beta fold hydrolase n=1 Tax=Iamia sp. SCSIO 61187 TaxID=2722752 RepID=UPI002107A51D|nr:alpha/beta hydrolase [Iamia sp. SCSIO 61187]QYG92137.1 alpha/beta hydrolase [Iamia sp. SCSIO 61187]